MTEALSSLAETFKNVGVARAYGPAVTVDGEELIPVALVTFGFGGGGNTDAGSASATGPESAAGGGGGGFVLPLGVYGRSGSGHVVFRPNTIALLAALTPLVCAAGYTVRGVLRTLRR
ncbi:hypothetical protein [Arthrobacter sp. EPSL27]|uniref:hypothetical protein n=1 Tax=Arthrobacter sp. EPSL27 TaxID=1745378 RepID=UPI00074ADDCD|nr:hypothetical protein [Arthrobacter sp. EPSL27]KUM33174.1 hypothetical protein AR539_14480 [Arthrobacter sp. EPSL27]